MIRPHPARWFELLVARDDTTLALEALAATGAVELEARAGTALPDAFADLLPLLQTWRQLALRYRAYWPTQGLQASNVPEPPLATLQRCVARLQAWAAHAEPLIRRLQDAEAEQADLERWRCVVAHVGDGVINFAQAGAAGPPLVVRLAVVPAGGTAPLLPDGLIVRSFEAEGWLHALAVGSVAQWQALGLQGGAGAARLLVPPPWLQRGRAHNLAAMATRLAALGTEARRLRSDLAALAEAHPLRPVLADAQRLQWVADNVHGLEAGELFCWITGWSGAPQQVLEAAIEACAARALLRLPPAPPGVRAPMLLANPAWVRPFEVFARALGMPSATEADPSVLLALAVPLMFGYMFGDVGQGLVIAAAGGLLRRRFSLARLFIAGGLAAAGFGLVFGSVFSLHVLPALWTPPLADPLAVLVVPLVGGALLLALGLLLTALEAHWRGELARWLATDAGYLACYLALVVSPLAPAALGIAAAGALLFCCGHALFERRAAALGSALGELLERLFQILINTLSFARVGAFALAHAGLSSAIVALMDAAAHPLAAGAVLVLGNLVVIVLEGLVVSIQTTRLVLFEFFARFLAGQGRAFHPLQLPPSRLAGEFK